MSKEPATHFQEAALLADEYVEAQRRDLPTAYRVRFKHKIEAFKKEGEEC